MPTPSSLKLIGRNLIALLFVGLPVFVALAWMQALLLGWEGSSDVSNVLTIVPFYTLVFVGPVVLGGIVHNAVVLSFPRSWSQAIRRAAAVLGIVLVPLTVALVLDPDYALWWYAGPIVGALAAYGLAFRMPQEQVTSTATPDERPI